MEAVATNPVAILNATEADQALLVAWLGDLDTPVAYWPTSDRDAFASALRLWVEREAPAAQFERAEESIEERVDRYMAQVSIELPEVTDAQIRALRAEAAAAGDSDMVRTCDVALDEDIDEDQADVDRARVECRDAILSARASA